MTDAANGHAPDDINALRAILYDALRGVKAGTLGVKEARSMIDIARTLIGSAKVEVDYLRVTGAPGGSAFLAVDNAVVSKPALPSGITGITRHRMVG